MNGEYWPRLSDETLKRAVQQAGVTLIEGPNGCGKATSAAQVARSYLHLRFPWHGTSSPGQANLDALRLGAAPRMFSECQAVGGLLAAAVEASDGRNGEYVLSQSVKGDAVPSSIARLRMRPMSLVESGESSGSVSLRGLFSGELTADSVGELTAVETAFAMVRGGWPGMIGMDAPVALRGAGEQLGTLVGLQFGRVGGLHRDAGRTGALMRALSRCLVTCAPLAVIRAAAAEEECLIPESTARRCLDILAASYLTEDVPAWHPPLRVPTAIRPEPKRQFADPSIACAVMGLSPADVVNDVLWFTRLFKSLCLRDLRVYADVFGAEIVHYRDARGLKADAVLLSGDGRWGAIEMALDVMGSEPAAARLLKLRDKVDAGAVGPPAFLAILTLTGRAHRRRDGVLVVPVSALGP